jgi:hypothetical protein
LINYRQHINGTIIAYTKNNDNVSSFSQKRVDRRMILISPFGDKECGEGTRIAPTPAIINAIYDAIGVRFKSWPVTPEQVLKALEKQSGLQSPNKQGSRRESQ